MANFDTFVIATGMLLRSEKIMRPAEYLSFVSWDLPAFINIHSWCTRWIYVVCGDDNIANRLNVDRKVGGYCAL